MRLQGRGAARVFRLRSSSLVDGALVGDLLVLTCRVRLIGALR
jgi:hypothetical protein